MKKKILGAIFVIAVAAVAAWNVSTNMKNEAMSDLALANVEALAQMETGGTVCYQDFNGIFICLPGSYGWYCGCCYC